MTVERQTSWTTATWIAGTLVIGLYLLTCGLYWLQINDDAFITFRYSKFLALGRGPYFNVGEHVEGYTNFLMMLLMAGAIRLFGSDEVLFVAKLTGVAGGITAITAAWALGRRWLSKIAAVSPHASCLAWGGAGLAAVTCAYAFNSTSGLETTLFSAWILIALLLEQTQRDEGRYRAAGAAFALAALTRPEGALVFAAAALGRLIVGQWSRRTERRFLIWDCAIVAGVVSAHCLFRYVFYDGELLPNTYYAKQGGYWGVTSWEYVMGFAYGLLGLLPLALSLTPLAAREKALRRDVLPALATAWASVGVIWLTGPDWMPAYRLMIPYVPLWGALFVCGIATLTAYVPRRTAVLSAATSLVFLVGLWFWQQPARRYWSEYCDVRAEGYIRGHAALADWLLENAKAGDTAALMDIGLVGYKCIDLTILDITGLTDRRIGKSPGGFLNKDFDPAYVFDSRPEYLVIAVQGPETSRRQNLDELRPWTGIEERLAGREEFRRHYADPSRELHAPDDLERLAGLFGARAAFRHWYPGIAYYLFVYQYHE